MPEWDLGTGVCGLKEVDLNTVRVQAEIPLHVMVIGEAGAGKTALTEKYTADFSCLNLKKGSGYR